MQSEAARAKGDGVGGEDEYKATIAAAPDAAWSKIRLGSEPPKPEEAAAAQAAMAEDVRHYGAMIASGDAKEADARELARSVIARNIAAFMNQPRNPFTNEELLRDIEVQIHNAAHESAPAAAPPKQSWGDTLNSKFGGKR